MSEISFIKAPQNDGSVNLGGAFIAKSEQARENGVCVCFPKGVSIDVDGHQVNLEGLGISVRPYKGNSPKGPKFLLSLFKATPRKE